MCAQACVTAYAHACTYNFMCTCVCYRAHVRASMCSATHVCIMCTYMRFRAHLRASMCNGVTAYIHVSTHACASEHVRVHVHFHVQMCVCVCFRAHMRASICSGMRASCAPAARASEHKCMQAYVAAERHTFMCARMRVLPSKFACTRIFCAHACASEHMSVQARAAAYTHACSMCTCVCHRARVRARAYLHVHMCVLPSTCARMHV